MTTLYGWAIPLQINLPADHTYVTCAGSKAWPCWGRSSGGTQICSGTGSSVVADCISKPWSTAKLVYGVTGVCHQTANRILWPAGVTVRKARGYWASWLLYGTYGKGLAIWLGTLAVCGTKSGDIPECSAGGKSKSMLSDEGGGPDEYAKRVKDYYEGLSSEKTVKSLADADSAPRFLDILDGETQIMLEERAGSGDIEKASSAIHAVRASALDTLLTLDKSFDVKSASREDTARETNNLVNRMLQSLAESLGGDMYSRIMELEPGETINIVDPEMMVPGNGEPRA